MPIVVVGPSRASQDFAMKFLHVTYLVAAGLALLSLFAFEKPESAQSVEEAESHHAVPNDNRHSAGSSKNVVIELHLDARQAIWQPKLDAGKSIKA